MARWWQPGSSHNSTCPDARTMLRLLSQPRPMEILNCLLDGELDVKQIANALDLNSNHVSPSLKDLHHFSLVEVKRVGKRHIYRLGFGLKAVRRNGKMVLAVGTADEGDIMVSMRIDRIRAR